jgi:hypothetical protein
MTKVYNLVHKRERQEEKAQFKKQRPWRDPKEDSSHYDEADSGDDDIQMDGQDSFRRNLCMGWVTPSPLSEVFPLSFDRECLSCPSHHVRLTSCAPDLSITSCAPHIMCAHLSMALQT